MLSAKRLIIIIMHVVELGQQFCDGRHVAYFMSLCFTSVIQYTIMHVRNTVYYYACTYIQYTIMHVCIYSILLCMYVYSVYYYACTYIQYTIMHVRIFSIHVRIYSTYPIRIIAAVDL